MSFIDLVERKEEKMNTSMQKDLFGTSIISSKLHSGGLASKKGRLYEKTVENILKSLLIPYETQVVYTGYQFGEKNLDFVIKTLKRYPMGLGVEIKTQISNGSADEKFSDFVKNIHANPYPTIVVCYFVKAKKESVAWLYEQVDGKKFVACMDFGKFISWIFDEVNISE
jgi:hypothetical protein